MMFRFGKIIDSGNKSTRSDRFAEMSKQQQLIESKKQEIKAKFEEMKRKESEDSNPKRDKGSNLKTNKDTRTSISSRMQSWKNDDRWRKKQTSNEASEASSTSNLFSNDGSFMEKYRKMAGGSNGGKNEDSSDTDPPRYRYDDQYEDHTSRSDNQHYNPKIERNTVPRPSSEGIPYPPPSLGILPTTSTLNVTSPAQSLYTLTAHPPPSVSTSIHTSLATVSASMPVLSAMSSSTASLQTVSLIQVPVSVPGSSVILSCPLETTLVSSEPVVHLPVVHSTLSHNSMSVPLQTVPLQTTVIPAQIQITSPANAMQTVQINQSSTNVLLPQSIIVPSECMTQPPSVSAALPNTNVPPPMLPVPPPSQPLAPVRPPQFSAAPPPVYSMPGHGVAHDTSKLPPIHLPPPNFNPIAAHYPEGVQHAPHLLGCKTSIKLEKDGCGDERTLITSEAEKCQTMRASRKREGGRDSISDSVEDIEAVARVVAECGDDMESVLSSKSAEDEKLSFLRDKQSPPYHAFRSMVEKIRKEKNDINNREKTQVSSERASRVPADQDDSDSEDSDDRRKRKRKRRSRWAPEDTKVEVTAPAVASANIGVATPLSLGGVVPVVPPTQQTKLPGFTGPIISQVTRTDPALLQYALKSFGTINLSEEDWKKAEDHYKINLLYQDMLKKRQELEKLQAAGRHKYAYDSDEDTEGGTWEHKLRQQEMVATQIWADELTERARGKHHIGDFLPPDELERFMEKYDALKQGREPDLSDYKEFKLKEDNIGFQMLQKLGWSEGQGLGSDGSGIVNPVNKAPSYTTSHGLGIEKPDDVRGDDDEFDAYRKRMMLAYRFRPNPLNNPRRPYY